MIPQPQAAEPSQNVDFRFVTLMFAPAAVLTTAFAAGGVFNLFQDQTTVGQIVATTAVCALFITVITVVICLPGLALLAVDRTERPTRSWGVAWLTIVYLATLPAAAVVFILAVMAFGPSWN